MQRPKLGKPVTFVRVEGGSVVWTTATLYPDKSLGFYYDLAESGVPTWYECSAEPDPDNWRRAVGSLAGFGYTELGEAVREGLVPPDWAPPEGPERYGRTPLAGG